MKTKKKTSRSEVGGRVASAKKKKPRRRPPRISTATKFESMCNAAAECYGPQMSQAMATVYAQGHREVAVVVAFRDVAHKRDLVQIEGAVMPFENALAFAREHGAEKVLQDEARNARQAPGAVPMIFFYRELARSITMLSPLSITRGGSA